MNVFERMKTVVIDDGVKPRGIRRQIANVCGVSYEAVRLWDNGDTKSIESTHIVRFCEKYHVNQRWLTTGKGSRDQSSGEIRENSPAYYQANISAGPEIRGHVPLIDRITAGQWGEVVDPYPPGQGEEMVTTVSRVGPRSFALRVEGDSMTAPAGLSIPDGYIVIVDPDADYTSGSIVVAKLDGDETATLKKLVIDGPNKYLRALNPTYGPIEINGNCRIVGVVKDIILQI